MIRAKLYSILFTFVAQVVQVYVSWTNKTVPVPKLQLVGFSRQRIEVGDTKSLTFTIKPEQLQVWMDDKTGWCHLTGALNV